MLIARKLLESIPPESGEVDFLCYSNFLAAISFDIHPKSKFNEVCNKAFNMDQTVYEMLVENILIQLSTTD